MRGSDTVFAMNARLTLPVLIAGLALFTTGCATVPETGRSQLLLISSSEEFQLGLSEFDKLKKTTPISKDAEVNAQVRRVGQRIAAVARLPNAQWEFVVFDAPQTANAFCLPGGKVGIYTGILRYTHDEAGLATVIGHEVAHAVARHGAERVSEGLLLQMGGQALGQAVKTNSAATQSIIMGAYGIGSAIGVTLPHSRSHELEADHLGLLYMARAGYDPHNAVTFWKRFSEGKSGGGIEWLSTHPLDKRRIAAIESHLPQALAEYQKARAR